MLFYCNVHYCNILLSLSNDLKMEIVLLQLRKEKKKELAPAPLCQNNENARSSVQSVYRYAMLEWTEHGHRHGHGKRIKLRDFLVFLKMKYVFIACVTWDSVFSEEIIHRHTQQRLNRFLNYVFT